MQASMTYSIGLPEGRKLLRRSIDFLGRVRFFVDQKGS